MNAKVLMAVFASLVGLSVPADVLYWQVNNTDADAGAKSEYAYALLRATDGNGGQYFVSENLDSSGNNAGAAISRDYFGSGNYVGGVMDAAKILSTSAGNDAYSGNISSLSFFLELYDSSGNWVGETTPAQAYDTLVNNGTISGFNANFTGVNNALGGSGATYRNVPEPTSGLLMLVGLGALALRRRKVA